MRISKIWIFQLQLSGIFIHQHQELFIWTDLFLLVSAQSSTPSSQSNSSIISTRQHQPIKKLLNIENISQNQLRRRPSHIRSSLIHSHKLLTNINIILLNQLINSIKGHNFSKRCNLSHIFMSIRSQHSQRRVLHHNETLSLDPIQLLFLKKKHRFQFINTILSRFKRTQRFIRIDLGRRQIYLFSTMHHIRMICHLPSYLHLIILLFSLRMSHL